MAAGCRTVGDGPFAAFRQIGVVDDGAIGHRQRRGADALAVAVDEDDMPLFVAVSGRDGERESHDGCRRVIRRDRRALSVTVDRDDVRLVGQCGVIQRRTVG